jgi:hypothetical protein
MASREKRKRQEAGGEGLPPWLASQNSPDKAEKGADAGARGTSAVERGAKTKKKAKKKANRPSQPQRQSKRQTHPGASNADSREHNNLAETVAQAEAAAALATPPRKAAEQPAADRTDGNTAEHGGDTPQEERPAGGYHQRTNTPAGADISPSTGQHASTPRRGLTSLLNQVLRKAEEGSASTVKQVKELANEQESALQRHREAVDRMVERWQQDMRSSESLEKELEEKKAEITSLKNENAKIHDDMLSWKEQALNSEAEARKLQRRLNGRDFLVTAAYTVSQHQQHQQHQQEQVTPRSGSGERRKRKSKQSQSNEEANNEGGSTPSTPPLAEGEEQRMSATALKNLTGFAWRKVRKLSGEEVHEFVDDGNSKVAFEVSEAPEDADGAVLLTVTSIGTTASQHLPTWVQSGGQYALSTVHELQLLFHMLGVAARKQQQSSA